MPEAENHRPIRSLPRRGAAAIVAVALLAVGGGVGAVAMHETRPSVTMAPATPVAIRSMQTDGIVTIRGRVAEIFGNKFIVQDQSGRALVETGREGEDGKLVTAGEAIMVQGRFDHGFLRAAFLVGPDAKVLALAPLGGPHGEHGRHGSPRGPEDGLDAPPPPPTSDVATHPTDDGPAPATNRH